jgi:hypothetical protein
MTSLECRNAKSEIKLRESTSSEQQKYMLTLLELSSRAGER